MKRSTKPIWIALLLSLFIHSFLMSYFNNLLEVSSNKKIRERTYAAYIALKLEAAPSPTIKNSRAPKAESIPDLQNIENHPTEKEILHEEERIFNKALPVEEIIQDSTDKKEISHPSVIEKIEDQEKTIKSFPQKNSTEQVTKEEKPQSLAEIKGENHQINQDPEKEQRFSSQSKKNEYLKGKPVQGKSNIAFQEADGKNEHQGENNLEIEEAIDFTGNDYSNNVNPPELLEFQLPVYPKNLRERDIEGKVTLKVLIDKDGKVKEIQIFESSGYGAFDQIAVKSVRQWQFKPAKKGNQTRESWVLVPVNFQIK